MEVGEEEHSGDIDDGDEIRVLRVGRWGGGGRYTGEREEGGGGGVCDKSAIHSQLFTTRTRCSSICVTFHHQKVKKKKSLKMR